jgi:hypothetical protein
MIPLQHTLQDSLTVRERPTCRVRRISNPAFGRTSRETSVETRQPSVLQKAITQVYLIGDKTSLGCRSFGTQRREVIAA